MMWQISAGLGIALALSLGSFKLYYDKAEAEKDAMESSLRMSIANVETLKKEMEAQNQQMQDQIERNKVIQERISILAEENKTAMLEVDAIRKKFAKHNLDVLSLRKPKLIEKIINKGTREVLDDLEAITDSRTERL
jgi:regulator of replication initiation timing|tara:strand:+ start:328 stop:738 length:411 start_codon:yes stop_codon:yes gene_type:complete